MRPIERLTVGDVLRAVHYDPGTGVFRWLKRGKIAGNIDAKGYRRINIGGKLYKAHRLAWLVFHGRYPCDRITFRNGTPGDLRIGNLRESSVSQTNTLAGVRRDCRAGRKGVEQNGSRYHARISHQGVRIDLGYFSSAAAAGEAYDKKAAELRGEFVTPFRKRGRLKSLMDSPLLQMNLAATAIADHENRRSIA